MSMNFRVQVCISGLNILAKYQLGKRRYLGGLVLVVLSCALQDVAVAFIVLVLRLRVTTRLASGQRVFGVLLHGTPRYRNVFASFTSDM